MFSMEFDVLLRNYDGEWVVGAQRGRLVFPLERGVVGSELLFGSITVAVAVFNLSLFL